MLLFNGGWGKAVTFNVGLKSMYVYNNQEGSGHLSTWSLTPGNSLGDGSRDRAAAQSLCIILRAWDPARR